MNNAPFTKTTSWLPHHHNVNCMFIHIESFFWQVVFNNLGTLLQWHRCSVGNTVLTVHAGRSLAQGEDRLHVTKLLADHGSLLQTPKQAEETTFVGKNKMDVMAYNYLYIMHYVTLCTLRWTFQKGVAKAEDSSIIQHSNTSLDINPKPVSSLFPILIHSTDPLYCGAPLLQFSSILFSYTLFKKSSYFIIIICLHDLSLIYFTHLTTQ